MALRYWIYILSLSNKFVRCVQNRLLKFSTLSATLLLLPSVVVSGHNKFPAAKLKVEDDYEGRKKQTHCQSGILSLPFLLLNKIPDTYLPD